MIIKRIYFMLRKIFFGVFIFAAVTLVGFTGVVGYAFYNSKPNYRVVAKNVEIDSEWKEIIVDPPMIAAKTKQMVLLSGKGLDTRSGDNEFEAYLSDGTTVKLEIEIVDSEGNIYETRLSTMNYLGPGFGSAQKMGFPKDREYTKIRLRSDKPITLSKIYWVTAELD